VQYDPPDEPKVCDVNCPSYVMYFYCFNLLTHSNLMFRITFTELVVLHVVKKAKEVHYCSCCHKN
jgi:hypothetical protein